MEDKFLYKPDFGETLTGKTDPLIYVLDVQKGTLETVLDLPPNVYPAHPIFDPQGEGLIFTGYKLPGMRLGLNICLNRPTSLFYATELRKDEKAEGKTKVVCLTELEYLAIAPRFNEDCTQLVYYASTEEFHQHATCHELKSIEWGEGGPISVGKGKAILEVVEEPDEEYSGLYSFQSDMLSS